VKRSRWLLLILLLAGAGAGWLGWHRLAPPKREAVAGPEATAMRGFTVQGPLSAGSGGASAVNFVKLEVRPPPALSATEAAFQRGLQPRIPPAKEPLRIPPGRRLRLSVKWVDDLAARAAPDGRLRVVSDDPARLEALERLARSEDLRFARLHTTDDTALAALRRRAAEASGRAQPDLAAQVEVLLAESERERVIALARYLHAMAEVEYAELESLDAPPPPPAMDIAPPTPLLEAQQVYRTAASGIDVEHVWTRYGIRGDPGLRVTDCEYQYNPDHEDLAGLVQLQPNLVSMYTAFGDDHGTAVLGVLASGWNAYGITGSVPDCPIWFYPEFSELTTGSQSRAACVTAAIADSTAGDVVMLEMQADGPDSGSSDFVPAEFDLSVWNAVKTGTDAGVITVAAAGNGNQNLDDAALFAGYLGRGDSGALIVGAGGTTRARLNFSTHGARVNLQGWGNSVFTTGYGGYATYGGDANQRYTSSFSGTSSATPVVTSAVVLLQSVAIRLLERRLTPAEVRQLLVDTGRAQTGATAATAPIGPLPDLAAACEALLQLYPPSLATWSSWGHYHLASGEPDPEGDPDGDGLGNLLEFLLGTHPLGVALGDANRTPRSLVEAAPGGGRQTVFEFEQPTARAGVHWTVQASVTLAANDWLDLAHGVDGVAIARVGERIRVSLPIDETRRFLRLRVELVP
jgi:hypothetical protein